ncbi:MAG TPA: glycosyltransferase, partial [Chthoniobacterales bacterium]
MKYCDLTQFYSPVSGGVRRYIEQKVAFLRSRRPDDEHILIVPGARTEKIGDAQSRIYTIESPLVSRTSRYRMLLKLHIVEEILERERPNLIESGDPYQVAWKAVTSGRALGIPAIGFYHSHFPEATIRSISKFFGRTATEIACEASRRYIRALYNKFERTVVPSPALAELLRNWGVENISNTDLGVDVDVFTPEGRGDPAIRASLGIPADSILLLYVGRLAPEKNVKTLFAAIELLHAKSPGQFHLLAVGDGTRRADLESAREATGAVSWLPYCGNAEELAQIYRAADVFVHPGILETFGLVTLETQACGTPVVGIRGSYMDRIIFTNQAHWARENTPEALAEAICAAAATDYRATGLAASRIVRERFGWHTVFDRLFGVYRNVIEEYSP